MSATTTYETNAELLARIQSGFSKNDIIVIEAFAAAGVAPDDITPRENVLTYKAWRAVGRQVAKGAKSLRVTVYIPRKKKKDDEKESAFPKTVSLFHISQTIAADAADGTKPDAWQNENLVRPGTYDEAAAE